MGLRRYIPLAVTAGAAVLIQLSVTAVGAPYLLTQLTMATYYSLVVMGLCLLMGYAGQISLGHAGFSAIGGYAAAALSTRDLSGAAQTGAVRLLGRLHLLATRTDPYGAEILSVAPWCAAVAAIALAAVAAVLIGIPALRLRGHYLAMATLGFGLIVHRVVLASRALGEADGLTGVPPLRIAALEVSGRLSQRVENYYIALAVVLLALLACVNLVHSRVGRALRAIHDSEEAASALGVDTARYKLATFVMSAVLAALAGILLTHYSGGIGPTEASVMRSIRAVSIVAVGGMGSLWGALVTSTLLTFLSLRGVFGAFDDAVFGAVLVAVMVFSPQGLPGLAAALRSLLRTLARRRRPGRV